MTAPSGDAGSNQQPQLSDKLERTSPSTALNVHSETNSELDNADIPQRKESSSEEKDDDEISTVLECSPCRRYEKGKEKVSIFYSDFTVHFKNPIFRPISLVIAWRCSYLNYVLLALFLLVFVLAAITLSLIVGRYRKYHNE